MHKVMRSPTGVDGGLDFFASNSHLATVSGDGEHPESKRNATGNRIPGQLEFLELFTFRLVIGRGFPRQTHRQLHRLLAIMMSDFLSELADRRARLAHADDFIAARHKSSGSVVFSKLLMPTQPRRRLIDL